MSADRIPKLLTGWHMNLIWCGVGLLAGLLLPGLLQVRYTKEINVSDLLMVFSTVALALVLGHLVQQRLSKHQVEKEIGMKKVRHVEEMFSAVQRLVRDCFHRKQITEDHELAIKLALTNLSNAVRNLELSLDYCKIRIERVATLKTQRREYKDVVTGEPFPYAPYSAERFRQEEAMYIRIVEDLHRLEIDVNRA